jgi:hypothetical protein
MRSHLAMLFRATANLLRLLRPRTAALPQVPLVPLVLLPLALTLPLSAQQPPDDSPFVIGSNNVTDPAIMTGQLHMTVAYDYAHPAQTYANYLDSNWVPPDPIEAMNQARYLSAYRHGLKLIVHPGHMQYLAYNSIVADNYLAASPDLQIYHLTEGGDPSVGHYDTLAGGFFAGYTVDRRDTTLMAGGPTDVQIVLRRLGQGLFDDWHHFLTDSAGRPRPDTLPSQRRTIDSLRLLYDSSAVFDFGFTMKSTATPQQWNRLDPDVVIAYGVIYVRDTLGQPRARDGCKCNFYRAAARVDITKRRYLGSATDDRDGYKTFDTLLDLAAAYRFDGRLGWNSLYDNNFGAGHRSDATSQGRFCDSLLRARLAIRNHADPRWLPPGSYNAEQPLPFDFGYRFYSTGRAPVTFLRVRTAPYIFTQLAAGRLDSLVQISVNGVFRDDRVDSLILRLGVADEIDNERTIAYSLLAPKLQRAIDSAVALYPGRHRKGIWANNTHNVDGFRARSGDFDSTRYRQVQVVTRQLYKLAKAIPVRYANPDSMGVRSTDTLYRMGVSDTSTSHPYKRLIMGNSAADYAAYTRATQSIFGRFLDYRSNTGDQFIDGNTTVEGPIIPSIARYVDVFRFKYRSRFPVVPSSPVWNVVQTHGFIHFGAAGYDNGFFALNIPTPEEISCQAWCSMNCNVQGILFGDLIDDGATLGVMRESDHASEYGAFTPWNYIASDTNVVRFDSTWLGRRSRFDAIRRATAEIHYIDSAVGWRNLIYNQEQMSVYDTRQSFAAMPMVDTLMAERREEGEGFRTGASGSRYDPREETYIELTHFAAGGGDSGGARRGVRYLLITNRRTWPIDSLLYSDSTTARFDRVDPIHTRAGVLHSSHGLGEIDRRRPVIVLKNSTGLPARRFLIEKISGEGAWSATAGVGERIPLDWLDPGTGALYRLTPVAESKSPR